MSEKQDYNQEPKAQTRALIGERVSEQLRWLNEAAEVIGGPNASIPAVFDLPPEVRDDAPMPDWTPEQTERIREIGQRFGYGAEQTVSSGLTGGVRIAEGGKVWKMMAEAEAFNDEKSPDSLIFAGSPYRNLGEDEKTFIEDKFGPESVSAQIDETEYDIAIMLAKKQADGVLLDRPVIASFGYDISEGNPTINQPTGQLIKIGETSSGQAVQVLRVDRDIYDGSKYRYQPDSAGLMKFMADVLTAQGKASDPVALVTSSTYASRQVDAIRSGLDSGHEFGVAMYGRSVIQALGASTPPEMPLNHLPGDLRITYDKLHQLRIELQTGSIL